jgi:hypothetical protein
MAGSTFSSWRSDMIDADRQRTMAYALDLKSLQIPQSIPVTEIEWEEYSDADGEPSLRIWVVFESASDAGDFSGDDVGDLKFAIRQSLRDNGITEFAYIFIVSEDERASVESAD